MIRELVTEAKTYRPFDPKTAKGLYLSVVPDAEGTELLASWGKLLGLNMTKTDISELHCTVIYSKTVPEGIGDRKPDPSVVYKAQAQGVEWWPGHDDAGYCVLRISCPSLVALNAEWIGYGCTRTFGTYLPHMTLKKDVGPMPPDFHVRRARLNRELGTFINLSNATVEALKG